MIIHCTNCTDKDNTALPIKYQDLMGNLLSVRGVMLCPRCKCPEVMTEDKNFSPSYGYNTGGKIENKRKTTQK